jgi:hypothetical protein
MKMYFEFNIVLNDKKVLFISTFLRDRAQHWFKSQLKNYLNNDENIKMKFSFFIKFKKKLQRIFEIFNEKRTAKRIIQHLIRKTSISNYVARFHKYANFTKWNDVAFMTMFRRELKNNVKNEMMRNEKFIENLNIMIEMTIDLDDKLYKRVMKRRHQNHRSSRKKFYVDHESHEYNNKKNSRQCQEQNFYEHTSMKLNVVKRKRSRINDKKQEKGKKIKSCYICDKEDHFAKNCKSKNNMIRRQQINITLKRQSRTENKNEWKKINYESNISTFNSKNEDFYRIKEFEDFQEILKERIKKTFASTKKINR